MKFRENMGLECGKRHLWEGLQRYVSGLHSLSVGQSLRDVMLSGDFVNVGFVRSNEVACAARVYNGSAVVGWFEVGN